MHEAAPKERGPHYQAACAAVRQRYQLVHAALDERTRRMWAAGEALAFGPGGTEAVHEATGLSRATIRSGIAQLTGEADAPPPGHLRRPGGGRKRLTVKQPELPRALEALLEPAGDPAPLLRWTTRSVRNLALALHELGFAVGPDVVAHLLRDAGYSLCASGRGPHPILAAENGNQFALVAAEARAFLMAAQPVVCLEAHRGECAGGDLRGASDGEHPHLQRVGVAADPALVAVVVDSLRRWWLGEGSHLHPFAGALLLVADCAGGPPEAQRSWAAALQSLADDIGLHLSVCHFPGGTTRWDPARLEITARVMATDGHPHRIFRELTLSTIGGGFDPRSPVPSAHSPRSIAPRPDWAYRVVSHASARGPWREPPGPGRSTPLGSAALGRGLGR